MSPKLEVLYEAEGLPAFDLPADLLARYGRPLGFAEPLVIANFVASLDGVVAAPPGAQSATRLAGGSEADRFVMGLLRACADVVLVGSGTLRGSPDSRWLPEGPFPAGAASFAEIRRRRRLTERPLVAVVTGSGRIDPGHPALEAGALVLTTAGGAARLRGVLPGASEIVSVGDGDLVDLASAVGLLRARGYRLVLSEAGPHVFGGLLAGRLVDELFLTVSPVIAGRQEDVARLGLIEGHDLLARDLDAHRLLSVRREDAHLFLRYALRPLPA